MAEEGAICDYLLNTPNAPRDLHLVAAKKYGWVFNKYQDDREMYIAAFIAGSAPILKMPTHMYKDKELMEIALKSGASLEYLYNVDLSTILSNFNRNEIINLLPFNGRLLKYCSQNYVRHDLCLQDDETAVRAAMSNKGSVLMFASKRLKTNSDLLLLAVSTDCSAYQYLADVADERATQEAMRRGGYNLEFTPKSKKTRDVVMLAVKESGKSLCYAPMFWYDDEIVAEALKQYPKAIQYISPRLKHLYKSYIK